MDSSVCLCEKVSCCEQLSLSFFKKSGSLLLIDNDLCLMWRESGRITICELDSSQICQRLVILKCSDQLQDGKTIFFYYNSDSKQNWDTASTVNNKTMQYANKLWSQTAVLQCGGARVVKILHTFWSLSWYWAPMLQMNLLTSSKTRSFQNQCVSTKLIFSGFQLSIGKKGLWRSSDTMYQLFWNQV